GLNRGHFASPIVDRLAARGRTSSDVASRRRIYARVQQRAAHDLPVVPLWWEDRVVVHTSRLIGFAATPSGDLRSLASARLQCSTRFGGVCSCCPPRSSAWRCWCSLSCTSFPAIPST